MIVHPSIIPTRLTTWLIARKKSTYTADTRRLTHRNWATTHKLNTACPIVTLVTQEAYDRLGINGEALSL